MNAPETIFPECRGRTVLLAAADAAWRDAAREALVPLRVSAVCAPDPATALAVVRGGLRPDLAAADLDAFGAGALDLVREIRARDRVRHTPVVLLSSELRPAAVRAALAAGADDCAARCPPEAFALLVAARFRFAALAPRVAPDTIESGPLLLEQESGRAFAGGRDLGLSPVESAMLGALVRNAGRCLSREEILRDMHGEGGGNVQARTIDATVVAVRRKLGRAGRCLETVRGAGYRWNAERRPFPRWVRGGAGALLVALGFALHAGVAELGPHAENAETKPHAESAEFAESKSHAESAETKPHAESAEFAESKSHAESAETKPHAESAEFAESKSHAESAELAEAQSPPPAAAAPLECRVYDVPPALLAALARPPSYKVTVVCVPSPRAGNAATAWVEATSDGTTWRRLAPVTPASLVKTIVFSNPIRDVRIVSDAPGPPAYDIREVVLAN
jgi:DNA-binding response OmpR family regulator